MVLLLVAVSGGLALAAPAAGQGRGALCRPDPARIPVVNACAGGPRVSVAVVGDVLLHAPLQRRGYAHGFSTIWGAAEPLLRAADIAIANLEGPTAPGLDRGARPVPDPGAVFDDRVYTGYPAFNYHPSVIDALRAAGVDAVSTANNHAMDRGSRGAAATMAELARRGMGQTGLIAPGAARDFVLRLPTELGALALIGCSYGTNGLPDPRRQVLLCYRDRAELLAMVRAEAARPGTAGVIVLPHWGAEYSPRPQAAQRALARDLAAAGALAVVGTHPHVVQPWEVLTGPRGQVPVVYSTGNFVAGQLELPRRTGLMAWLDLCRTPRGVAVGALGHLPMVMTFDRGPVLSVPGPGADGIGAEARTLLSRLVPGTDLAGALTCTGSVARPARAAPITPGTDPRFPQIFDR